MVSLFAEQLPCLVVCRRGCREGKLPGTATHVELLPVLKPRYLLAIKDEQWCGVDSSQGPTHKGCPSPMVSMAGRELLSFLLALQYALPPGVPFYKNPGLRRALSDDLI